MPTRSLLLLCLAFAATSLSARDIHVDASTGDDANDGTKDKPFRTLTKAATGLVAGDRVRLAPGIYREIARIGGAGTKENPAIIESADPLNPAIITGADAITGWQPLTGSNLPESKHPQGPQIHYTEIDWLPQFLFAGASKQRVAREPNTGWFSATTTDGKIITSPQLAGVDVESLEGAQLFFFLAKGVVQNLAEIQGWTGGKGSGIELQDALFRKLKPTYSEGDRFYIQNHIDLIDQPGEWVTQKTDTGTRIFWWPPSKEALAQAEAPKRIEVMNLSEASHLVVRNLHVRHGAADSNGFGIGFSNSPAAEGTRVGVTLDSCSIYQNQRFGAKMDGTRDATIKGSLVVDNSYGVNIMKSRNVVVEGNEIAWNLNDGLVVAWDVEDVIVKQNAIHHHSRFAHPDNFQTYRGVKNVLLDSNVLVASGQGAHNQQVVDFTARNNIFAGSSANLFFLGGPDTKNTGTQKEGGAFIMENNTFALFANGAVVIHGDGHKLEGNIFDVRGGKYAYGGKVPATSIASRNNRFWFSGGSDGLIATLYDSKNIRYTSLAGLQEATGLEESSTVGDPGFPTAPTRMVSLDGTQISQSSESLLYYDGTGAFKPGDHLEFDFDGVDRVVKEVGEGSVVIAPPLETAPVTTVLMANWGDKPVGPIDLRNTSGDKRGADLNFEGYLRGDFDGDGKRDVPPWPEGIKNPRKAL